MKICKDRVVTIEYRMVDQEGTLIDSSDDGESLSFIQGRETLFPAIEAQVEGCRIGDRRTFALEPDQAFGARDVALIRKLPHDRFSCPETLRPGMTFAGTAHGRQRPVTIIEVNRDSVTIDANHPLAGKRLNVDLVIVDIREAVEDELATGLVQEMADIYAREEGGRLHGLPVRGPC